MVNLITNFKGYLKCLNLFKVIWAGGGIITILVIIIVCNSISLNGFVVYICTSRQGTSGWSLNQSAVVERCSS